MLFESKLVVDSCLDRLTLLDNIGIYSLIIDIDPRLLIIYVLLKDGKRAIICTKAVLVPRSKLYLSLGLVEDLRWLEAQLT